MQPDELDDLFRQELDGHATPPAADLWARLQARTSAEAPTPPAADPLDAQFRGALAGHASPVRRELWERLEDEHLRPRPRRRVVVAWGRLAVAASLLLFVLAGGAGLWRRQLATRPGGPVAATGQRPAASRPPGTRPLPAVRPGEPNAAGQPLGRAARANQLLPNASPAVTATASRAEIKAKSFFTQATATAASPSSSPVARTTRERRPTAPPLAVPRPASAQPDAAANALAQRGERPAPAVQPSPLAPVVAATAPAEAQVIEVEVRRGSGAARPAPVVASAPTAVPARPRLRLGGLLRQAGHALRGEQVSLAEATADLPESVTVQARLGGRTLSKTIQL